VCALGRNNHWKFVDLPYASGQGGVATLGSQGLVREEIK
jgi:hypothetical protein